MNQQLNFTERESRAFRRFYDRYSNELIDNRGIPIECVLRMVLNFERIAELGERPFSIIDQFTITVLFRQNRRIAQAYGF